MLQVLDKVNAENAVLTVKVGQSAQFGSLTIQVQACQYARRISRRMPPPI